MKPILVCCCLITTIPVLAATLSDDATKASELADDFAVISRDANQRTWERTEYETLPDGSRVPRVRRVIELATGMHYRDASGTWQESKEEIERIPGGAVARQGQHKVIFAANLNTEGAIDLETPDGKRLQSSVLGLAYFDAESGKYVVIAEVKDCEGEVLNNRVLYPDAFDGLKADVRYTYTRAGFEQDIILREQLPSPAVFGLDPAATTLQAMTEFFNPPNRLNGRCVPDRATSFLISRRPGLGVERHS